MRRGRAVGPVPLDAECGAAAIEDPIAQHSGRRLRARISLARVDGGQRRVARSLDGKQDWLPDLEMERADPGLYAKRGGEDRARGRATSGPTAGRRHGVTIDSRARDSRAPNSRASEVETRA